MDATGIVALALAFVLALALGGLRRRVHRLEDLVLRLQDRINERATPASPDEAASTIDIEPFVD
jgi:hypothetical protein